MLDKLLLNRILLGNSLPGMTDERLKIIFASHTWMGDTFVVGSHHLSVHLAGMGHRVLHVSTPVTPAHLLRATSVSCRGRFGAWFNGGVVRRNGVVDYVPMSLFPWPVVKGFVRSSFNPFLATLPGLKRVVRHLGLAPVDVLLVDQPYFAGIDRILKPAFMIYRSTDLYAEMTGDTAGEAAQNMLVSRADGLVATSDLALARLRETNSVVPSLLLENGVEYDHFASPATPAHGDEALPAAQVVYVGSLDDRFDFSAVEALSRALPGIQILIIGPITHAARSRLSACRNVILAGPRSYAVLPAILQRATVGILPLSDHPGNASRSPMKLYEYAAAGLPVVARSTPELARRREPFVNLYEHTSELVSLVAGLLKDPPEKSWVQSLAKRHSWSTKAEALLKFISESRARKFSE